MVWVPPIYFKKPISTTRYGCGVAARGWFVIYFWIIIILFRPLSVYGLRDHLLEKQKNRIVNGQRSLIHILYKYCIAHPWTSTQGIYCKNTYNEKEDVSMCIHICLCMWTPPLSHVLCLMYNFVWIGWILIHHEKSNTPTQLKTFIYIYIYTYRFYCIHVYRAHTRTESKSRNTAILL